MHATWFALRQKSIASFWLSFRASLNHFFSSPLPGRRAVGSDDQLGCSIPSSELTSGPFSAPDEAPGSAAVDGATIRSRWSNVLRMRSKVTVLASFSLLSELSLRW